MTSRDQRQPRPVEAERLNTAQSHGWSCVWCNDELTSQQRLHVGYLRGQKLYACGICGHRYRVPMWPEYGSA
jgi:transcription elongation factor Elf1